MLLLKLPNEVLDIIASELTDETAVADLDALTRSCRQLFTAFVPHLYRRDTEHYDQGYYLRNDRSTALVWASCNGREETVRRAASVAPDIFRLPPLTLAVKGRQYAIVEMFLAIQRIRETLCDPRCSNSRRESWSYCDDQRLGRAAAFSLDPATITKAMRLGLCQGGQSCLDELGQSPLEVAVRIGDQRMVDMLLAIDGINVDAGKEARFLGGNTPLLSAVLIGHDGFVRALLALGADTETTSPCTSLPTELAAIRGHRRVLETLLDIGGAGLGSSLYHAVTRNRLDIVEILLDRGADIESAVENRQLQAGSFFPIRPITALQAALSTHPDMREMVQLLLARGADPEAVLDAGKRALHIYSKGSEPTTYQLLIDHGANVHAREETGATPLMCAARAGSVEMIRILLEHWADIDARDLRGYTPLLEASQLGTSTDAVDFLLKNGADIAAVSGNASSVMLVASWTGNLEVMKVLIKHGAAVDAGLPNGDTPLFNLCEKSASCGPEVRLLLENGADPNVAPFGITPLQLAAQKLNLESVRVLLEYGADPINHNWASHQPRDEELRRVHQDMEELLFSHSMEGISWTQEEPLDLATASVMDS
jgi:ankyrin repeat protein